MLLLLPLLTLTASPPATAIPPAEDVSDTHRRLETIYDRLGIRRAPEKEPPQPQAGCQPPGQRANAARAPAALGYVILALVLAAMIVPLLLALARTLTQRAPSIRGEQLAAREGASDHPAARPPPDLQHCRMLLAAGQLAEAFAALHRLALEELAQRQHLRLEQSTTNWGYVRQLAQKPALQQLLSALTLAAERAVLGQTPPPPAHYQALEQALQGALETRA